jgi:hypothetical protein
VCCFQFDDLHIIAAAFAVFLHAAVGTFVRMIVANLCTGQAVHAIMKRYHEAGTYRKVNKKQYGYEDFFHRLYKDINAFQKSEPGMKQG